MKFPSRLRRTILCLPFFFWIGDHAHAAPALRAAADPGAQPVALAPSAFDRCADIELAIGDDTLRIACDRLVASPGGRYWDGHLAGSAEHRLSFQIRAEGVTGLLDIPGRPLRLGLVDGVQWLLDTPPAQLKAEFGELAPPLFVLRGDEYPHAPAAESPGEGRLAAARAATDPQPAEVAYPVTLNLSELASVQPGGQVDLSLPGLQQNVTYERTRVSPDGRSTWFGYLTQYGRDYAVVLTYGVDGTTTGSIQGPSGEWLVSGKPGQTWLIDTAASGIRHNPNAKDGDALPPPHAAGKAEADVAGATASSGSTTSTGTTAAADTTGSAVVDVLVLYTPGLATRYGGDAGAATRIDHFIALANDAYANGNIGITLRRVGLQRVDIADNTANNTTLGQLRSGSGAFSSIATLRNSVGADGVLLVRPFDMAGQGGNCGVGYIGGYGGTPMSGYADYAYAVVSEGNDTKGQPYYCTDTTFAHELGHNMGLMHDRATVASQGGGSGALPYAFGYGKSGQFGTIMSYINPVVTRFSNPRDTNCSGSPCGIVSTDTTSSADNAQALGITRTPFSAYRATTTTGQVSVAGIITVNGAATANVKVLANGAQCGITGSTGAYACSFAAGWSGTIAPSATNVTFTPASADYSGLQASESRNFVGVSNTFAVRGTATVDGKLVAGVAVAAGGKSCGTTSTTGAFTCTVANGFTGNITGTRSNATFKSVSLNSVAAPQTVTLVGTSNPTPTTIRGVVRINGAAAAGAMVTATGATCSTTDLAGGYMCTLLTHSTGTIAATFKGTTFAPAQKSFTNLLAPLTQDFAGTRPQVAITGKLTVAGKARAGVTIRAGVNVCSVSNSVGEFNCTRPKAWSGRITAPDLSSTAYVAIDNLTVPTRADLVIP